MSALPERYQNVTELGRGFQSQILLADDTRTNQKVVLKLFLETIDDALLQDFEREAQMISCLTHPGILQVVDRGRLPEKGYYVVWPQQEGAITLERWIWNHYQETKVPPKKDQIFERLREIARAVDFLHSQGALHRDLKPSNILLLPSGSIKLSDVGLSGRVQAARSKVPSQVSAWNAISYLSPEQMEGSAIGDTSDVYQMGLILHEIFTGERAFPTPASRPRPHAPVSPATLCRWIGLEIDAVVRRATDPQPGRRQSSCENLMRALSTIAETRWYVGFEKPGPPPGATPMSGEMLALIDVTDIIPDVDEEETFESSLPKRLGEKFKAKYELRSILGKGAAGVVYRVKDLENNRHVAIKFMQAPMDPDDPAYRRFAREARILGKLNHPNVVKVFDTQVEGELAYTVCEYVPGETLDKVILKEAPMDPEKVKSIALDVLAGLDRLHEEKIIHRDIKPSNLIMTPTGVRIIDLGIAREESSSENLTRAGDLVGTPAFVPPEQIQSAGVDYNSDLYSLGLVLYNCLTGRLPFEGTMIESLSLKVRGEYEAVEKVVPTTPAYLAQVVGALLMAKPDARPQSAKEARRMLQNAPPPVTSVTDGQGARPLSRTTGKIAIPVAAPPPPSRLHYLPFLLLIPLVGFAGYRFRNRIALTQPVAEQELGGMSVRFSRTPPGPAMLRLSLPGQSIEIPSFSLGSEHRVAVTDLSPGDAVTAVALSDEKRSPDLAFTYQPLEIRDFSLNWKDSELEIAFKTPVGVRSSIQTRSADGLLTVEGSPEESTDHRVILPVASLPFSRDLKLVLARGDEQARVRRMLEGDQRRAWFEGIVPWFDRTVKEVRETLDGMKVTAGKKPVTATAALAPLVDLRPVIEEAASRVPPDWFLIEIGGTDGVLEQHDLEPETKDRFNRAIGELEMLDALLGLAGSGRSIPYPRLHGRRFGPMIASRLADAKEIALPLAAFDQGAEVAMSPGQDPMEVVVEINDVTSSTLVELAARVKLPAGRCVRVLVNGAYEVRLTRPSRDFPAEDLIPIHAAFEGAYLEKGMNTFAFSVPAMPAAVEGRAVSGPIIVAPPGFTLKLQPAK